MTPVHLRSQWWAVECPSDSIDHQTVHISPGIDVVHCYVPGEYAENKSYCINLPPGNWQIICTLKECTTSDAVKIVDSTDSHGRGLFFMNYNNGMYVFGSPLSSLRSLIRSNGLDENNNILIMQNNSNVKE